MRYFESRLSKNEYDILTRSRDASYYHITPEAVFFPQDRRDILALLDYCRHSKKSATFRASGTSLSGQTLGKGIIADISRYWVDFSYNTETRCLKSQPGAIAGKINRYLARFGRKLGPDPASINAASIGGIVSNNSSGMSSGIARNSYSTIKSLTYILPNGSVINSNNSDNDFKAGNPIIHKGLLKIRQAILEEAELINRIKEGYKVKNVIGYSMNSFIDYEKPFDILTHLMIGSEGTLGFIEEIELETFPIKPHVYTILLSFNNLDDTGAAINELLKTNPSALEIMDYTAVRSVGKLPTELDFLNGMNKDGAVLLIEHNFQEQEELMNNARSIKELTNSLNYHGIIETSEPTLREKLWYIRRGILTSIGGNRPPGTSIVIEDIAVPRDLIAGTTSELRRLIDNHGFSRSAIFGHCLDGNLHFLLPIDFNNPGHLNNFNIFMDLMIELVLKAGGSLKAEHGTGRSMAPFVAKQWGEKLYNLMSDVKKLIDPDGILNPDVIISNDKNIHIKHLKEIRIVDTAIDKCIECGFCEHICPSRNLTFTPRHRILTTRCGKDNNNTDFNYKCLDTCAVDGQCELACPIGINVGDFVKSIRNSYNSDFSKVLARNIEDKAPLFEIAFNGGIRACNVLTKALTISFTNAIFKPLSIFGAHPKWSEYIGNPIKIDGLSRHAAQAIYFPCCVSRLMGKPDDELPINQALINICNNAGIPIAYPRNIKGLCCGMAFGSKGYKQEHRRSITKLVNRLYEDSNNGELPIVFDSSSCYHSFITQNVIKDPEIMRKWQSLKIYDGWEFVKYHLIDKLKYRKLEEAIALHINCAVRKAGKAGELEEFCRYFANEVYVPLDEACCGYAGDRGITHPELTRSASKPKAHELTNGNFEGYYSTNIPCQTGMADATSRKYLSIFQLINKCLIT